jgi:hypothetical protein
MIKDDDYNDDYCMIHHGKNGGKRSNLNRKLFFFFLTNF